jgi:hypothetical protein
MIIKSYYKGNDSLKPKKYEIHIVDILLFFSMSKLDANTVFAIGGIFGGGRLFST